MTLTDNLEIQGHTTLHVILRILATTYAWATKLILLLMFYGSRNSFQVLRNAWPWRMTLKFNVTWFCTWP